MHVLVYERAMVCRVPVLVRYVVNLVLMNSRPPPISQTIPLIALGLPKYTHLMVTSENLSTLSLFMASMVILKVHGLVTSPRSSGRSNYCRL